MTAPTTAHALLGLVGAARRRLLAASADHLGLAALARLEAASSLPQGAGTLPPTVQDALDRVEDLARLARTLRLAPGVGVMPVPVQVATTAPAVGLAAAALIAAPSPSATGLPEDLASLVLAERAGRESWNREGEWDEPVHVASPQATVTRADDAPPAPGTDRGPAPESPPLEVPVQLADSAPQEPSVAAALVEPASEPQPAAGRRRGRRVRKQAAEEDDALDWLGPPAAVNDVGDDAVTGEEARPTDPGQGTDRADGTELADGEPSHVGPFETAPDGQPQPIDDADVEETVIVRFQGDEHQGDVDGGSSPTLAGEEPEELGDPISEDDLDLQLELDISQLRPEELEGLRAAGLDGPDEEATVRSTATELLDLRPPIQVGDELPTIREGPGDRPSPVQIRVTNDGRARAVAPSAARPGSALDGLDGQDPIPLTEADLALRGLVLTDGEDLAVAVRQPPAQPTRPAPMLDARPVTDPVELEPAALTPLAETGPDPDHVERLVQSAEEAIRRGDLHAATEAWTELIELVPDHAVAYIGRGRCHLELGDYSAAMSDFKKSEDLRENDPEPLVAMGDLYFVRKDYGRAIEYFSAAIDIDGAHAMARCRRGISHYYRKAYKEAFNDLQKAYNLDPEIPNIRKYVQMAIKRLEESGAR